LLIDPFTVGAQILNFLVLVWLLKRFLYGPITRAMEAREARIHAVAEDARRLHAEAEAEGERYRRLVSEFDAQRESRLTETRRELESLERAQIRRIRGEVEAMRERWLQMLTQEQEAFLAELRTRVGHASMDVVRRVLNELADSHLEDRLITRFLHRLDELDAPELERLVIAAHADRGRMHLRTAHPLSQDGEAGLRKAVAELFGEGLGIDFSVASGLIAGVELRAGGLKVAWTIDEHLRGLEETLANVLGDRSSGTASDAP